MKIAIVGNAGSGKSTLALRLHKILGIPLYHLDQYFWKPGWVEPSREDFEKVHQQLCNKDEWIIEGMAIRFFEYRIEKADIIIFIDAPTYRCFYRVFKRVISCFGREYFASAKGCPEGLPSWKFLKFIWHFNAQRRPVIKELLQTYRDQKKIFVVHNNAEVDALVYKFELGLTL